MNHSFLDFYDVHRKKLDIVLKNAKTLLSLCLISKSWQKTIINITNYETFKSNVTVGCHLVNLALEEVSVEFHSTIFTFGIMSKLLLHSLNQMVEFHSTILTLGIMSKLLLHSLNQMVRCRRQGQDGSRNRISPRVFSVHRQSGCARCPYRISPPRG